MLMNVRWIHVLGRATASTVRDPIPASVSLGISFSLHRTYKLVRVSSACETPTSFQCYIILKEKASYDRVFLLQVYKRRRECLFFFRLELFSRFPWIAVFSVFRRISWANFLFLFHMRNTTQCTILLLFYYSTWSPLVWSRHLGSLELFLVKYKEDDSTNGGSEIIAEQW